MVDRDYRKVCSESDRLVVLQKGRVVVRAAKQRRGSVLAVATPRARVSVVGTVFLVDSPKGLATTVDVLQGATQVVGADDPSATPDQARVRAALAAVPDDQRAVLALAYFDGLSCSEIAARLDVPIGTVKSRLAAGLTKLRQTMGAI